MKIKILFVLAVSAILMQGCMVQPSLTYGYTPKGKISENATTLTHKIVIMKPLDLRGHPGTTPIYWAYLPLVPYIRVINEPEQFVYTFNGFKYDYEADFENLVSMDLQSSGIADSVVTSPDAVEIPPLITGPARPDYIIKISIQQLDWQTKYTMYCLSIVGYVPQIIGYPNSYGFSFLKYTVQVLDSQGKPIAEKSFSAAESQNGWIYYYGGYLRALTRAYEQTSPEFRNFLANTIRESSHGMNQENPKN